MQQRRLGRTNLQVSEVGFGAWAIGGNKHGHSYGSTDNAESLRAIARALDLGCTFFDTADLYGHGLSEKLLGQALEKHRQACVIATKVGGDFYQGRSARILIRTISVSRSKKVWSVYARTTSTSTSCTIPL